jgi:hypothetical protein
MEAYIFLMYEAVKGGKESKSSSPSTGPLMAYLENSEPGGPGALDLLNPSDYPPN